MYTFKQYINEKNLGIEYERQVKKILRDVSKDFPNIRISRGKGSGKFSAHDVDLNLQVNNQNYNIEIKKNSRAQMGGFSLNYNRDKKELFVQKKVNIDDETMELILESLKDKIPDIEKTLQFFEKNDPIFQFNKKPDFPLNVSQDIWKDAIDKEIIKKLNTSISNNTSFIASYYKSKNVDYIQIGDGAGLFYFSNNPLKLPIPKINGEINIEFRASKSGIKQNKTNNYEYSTVVLRLIGRLQFKGTSPLSLDNEENVKEIFNSINKE